MAIPSPAFFAGGEAFALVLGMAPRIVMASLLAYVAGEFLNAIVLSKMKLFTGTFPLDENDWLYPGRGRDGHSVVYYPVLPGNSSCGGSFADDAVPVFVQGNLRDARHPLDIRGGWLAETQGRPGHV
jgi:hypothetical protein